MKKAIRIILILLLLGVFGFSGWQVVNIVLEYRQGEQVYLEMEKYVSFPEPMQQKPTRQESQQSAQMGEPEETVPEETQAMPTPWPQVDFAALQKINPDVVGWIYIPDTRVNYPIVQGSDNNQYLYHLITGEYNSAGSIFLQMQISSDFSEKNSPIYGHNMKNGTMFADITGYKAQSFYDDHPVAYLLTPEENYIVHIFSGYVTDEWSDSWQTDFTEEEFADWLDQVQRRSYFTPVRNAVAEDCILTFSTCTYEVEHSRFVVHGILESYKNE